jgi:ABC-2 type transport system permease protein
VSFNFRAFRALLLANLRTFLRNPLPSSGLMIVLVLLLFGVKAIQGLQGQPVKVVVADQAQTAASGRIVADLKKLPGLAISEADAMAAHNLVTSGAADLELLVPAGVGATDAAGHLLPAGAEVYYRAGGQGDQAASLVAAAVDKADRETQGAPQLLTVRTHLLNADQRILELFLPGVLAFNVINAGLILAAGIFAGYRTSGTLRRIQATGIRPTELVLAHAASNLILAGIQVVLMLIAAEVIFATAVNVLAMLGVTMLGYLVFLGIGLAVSGWVRDPQRAPVVATSIAFPMIFIGLFPSQAVGGLAGQLLGLLPVTMTTHALHQIAVGSSLGSFGGDLGGLVVWAVVALAAAGRVFRWDD